MREDTRSHKHRMGKSKFMLEVDAELLSQKIPELVQSYDLEILAFFFIWLVLFVCMCNMKVIHIVYIEAQS